MTRDGDVATLLARLGFDPTAVRGVEALAGGVSSDVFRVDLADRSICVKFAIERLRVARDWHAPIRRARAEYRWLATVGEWLPDAVPQVIGYDDARHGMVMAYLPPDVYPNWKADLLRGHVDPAVAAAVGARLAAIHARSAVDARLPAEFANHEDFEALRIEPYLRFTASRHPGLAARLEAVADRLAAARIALVHGDVSPKNILCGPEGPVFIDAECATWGDPAFDVAFVLNHLAIKALVLAHGEAVHASACALWDAYRRAIAWEAADALEARVAALLPALMLARVDGKSPLEYLTGESAALVRERACDLLRRRPDSVAAILSETEVTAR